MSVLSANNFEGSGPLVNERLFTAIAGENLAAGVYVEVSADWTVKASTFSTTPSNKVIGITRSSALSGKAVSILGLGWVVRMTAYGAISAGDTVASAPGGYAQTIAQPTVNDMISSAGIAAVISKMAGMTGIAIVGASSGGSAYIVHF